MIGVSKCCGVGVRCVGSVTVYAECRACGQPCDALWVPATEEKRMLLTEREEMLRADAERTEKLANAEVFLQEEEDAY